MVRTLAVLLALLLATGGAWGQDEEKSNEEKYAEKMKKKFVSAIDWEQSLEKAQAKAAEQNKLIFAYFSRSYAP